MATDWQIIPTATALDLPHFSQQVTLEGDVWTLVFQWSPRARFWSMALLDEHEGNIYRCGQPVVLRTPLLPGIFGGVFIATATQPLAGVQADLANLTLYYIPAQAYAEALGLA